MFDILNSFVRDAENLVIGGIDVLAIVFVGWTWWRTKAAATTVGALLFAAVIVFGVNNVDILSGDIEKDVDQRRRETTNQSNDPRAQGD
jgi:hypothetical protein